MSENFSEPISLRGKVKVVLDLSNYATKANIKNAAGVGLSKFAKNVDLASLKVHSQVWDNTWQLRAF